MAVGKELVSVSDAGERDPDPCGLPRGRTRDRRQRAGKLEAACEGLASGYHFRSSNTETADVLDTSQSYTRSNGVLLSPMLEDVGCRCGSTVV